MIKGGKSRKNKAGLQCLGSTVLSHLLLQFRGAATTVGSQFPFQEADFPESVVTSGIHRRRQWARGGRGWNSFQGHQPLDGGEPPDGGGGDGGGECFQQLWEGERQLHEGGG